MTAGASAVLMVIAGGAAGIAQLTKQEPRFVTQVGEGRTVVAAPVVPGPVAAPADTRSTTGTGGHAGPVGEAQKRAEPVRRTHERVDRTAPRTPAKQNEAPPRAAAPRVPAAEPAATAPPQVTTRTETERRAIPFRTRLVRDPSLPRGAKRIQTPGVPGEELLRYVITMTDGRPGERRLLDSRVTREPQHRVVAFGTRRKHCRHDRCGPMWRNAACEKSIESTEDLSAILSAEDVRALELEPGLLC
ncbi:hypothetical protein Acsp02_29560 [Actinoplanes sp. NBRC 103695]|nr:hypothetical protein Acsp02_29560 [Actinoplanes sp. NBRC 103695]